MEHVVVAVVARPLAAQHEGGGEQGARPAAELPVTVAGERPPSRAFVHAVERPLDAPLGGCRRRLRLRQTGAGGLLRLIVTPAWRVML